MNRFEIYPSHVESNVPRLGKIPGHWSLLKNKYLASFSKGKNPAILEVEPQEGAEPYLSMEYLRKGTAVQFAHWNKALTRSFEGEILVLWDGSNSGEFLRSRDGILSSTMAKANLKKTLNSDWYWYASKVVERELKNNTVGMGIPHLDGSLLREITIPTPSPAEQKTIAAFLDYETAKIDQLIAKQIRLIALLKEKRQAVISHAVTKGLNPNAPMKDSGVEWLGEVPEHWTPTRLKFISKIVDCKNRTPEAVEESSYLVVRTSNVRNGVLSMKGMTKTTKSDYLTWTARGVPLVGSIFFTREAPTGEVCIVPDDALICMGQRMMNFIPNNELITNYLLHALQSKPLKYYIESVSPGSTVTHLRVEQVYEIPIALPPVEECLKIIKHLKLVLEKLAKIEEQSKASLILLKERRSALISAAVTGKIDVRGWVAPAAFYTQ